MRIVRSSHVAAWALCAVLAPCATTHAADWTPREHPNPQAILNEARADARAGKYEQALAKHIWFHEHCARVRTFTIWGAAVVRAELLAGTRQGVSPCLSEAEGPGDQALKLVTPAEGKEIDFHDFHDLAALNRTLNQQEITAEAFRRLDAVDLQAAQRVYGVAEPALIKAKDYKLCAKYIDAKKSVERIVDMYARNQEFAKNPLFGHRHKEYMIKKHLNDSATLVALLAIDDRREEAEDAARDLKKVEGDASFHAALGAELDRASRASFRNLGRKPHKPGSFRE